jgi:hypothetical protein
VRLNLRTLLLIGVAVLVVGFVLANRLGGGTSTGGTATSATGGSTIGGQPNDVTGSSEPTTGKGQDHAGDDGTDDAPVMVEPTEQPDVQEAAAQFAAAWLNAYGQSAQQWRDGLTARMTDDLVTEMAMADPKTVPAGAKVGEVNTTVQGALLGADVTIVTDAAKPEPVGMLRLTLVEKDRSWLVTEIDWEAAK